MSKLTDVEYLTLAYNNAAWHSKDPSTNTGAILVGEDGNVVSFGANHFPMGVEHKQERLADRDTKLFYIEHAERNAIYAAARQGFRTLGLTMYAPWFACADCGRAIIQAGIKEVVGHQLPNDITPERWKKSINNALDMLREAGVQLRWVDAPIPNVKIKFNGKVIPLDRPGSEILKEYFSD